MKKAMEEGRMEGREIEGKIDTRVQFGVWID
jgi:hypothetical protein